jgi:hypothetical protein
MSILVAPPLSSRSWVDPFQTHYFSKNLVTPGIETRDLWVFSQELRPLDQWRSSTSIIETYGAWGLQTMKYSASTLRLVSRSFEYVHSTDTRNSISDKLYIRKINILTNFRNLFGRKLDHFFSVLRESCRQFQFGVRTVFRLVFV